MDTLEIYNLSPKGFREEKEKALRCRKVGGTWQNKCRGIPGKENNPCGSECHWPSHSWSPFFLLKELPVLLGIVICSANSEISNGSYQEVIPGRLR